ncbi:MAG: hypothetical protein K1X71_19110 [Pirellulales bacterium]|nr:hypothetical protein [Pirellulales bacterium]
MSADDDLYLGATTGGSIYVGTVGEGLWRSRDRGESWTRLKGGILSECDVRAIVIDPSDEGRMWLGTNEGVFYSTDAGDAWTACGGELAETVVWSLALSPHDPAVLLAGARPARVFRSADGGRCWQRLPIPVDERCVNPAVRFNRVTTVAFDPADARRMWVGVEIGGIYTSQDDGQTWIERRAGLSSLDIHGLAIVPLDGHRRRLVASTDNDINHSHDEGATWQPQNVTAQFPHRYCRGIAQQPGQPRVLYLGNGDGPPGSAGAALRSTDGGATWTPLPLPGVINSTIWNFAMHSAAPKVVLAYSVSGQVFDSADGGASWQKLRREFGEIRALAWTP